MTEADLVRNVLDARLPTDRYLPREIYCEPKLPTGYPDIVVAYHAQSLPDYSTARELLSIHHMKLLHFILMSRGANLATLESQILYSRRKICGLVEDLVAAGLLRVRGTFVRNRSLDELFPIRRIVAIEAKLSDWKRALKQAAANIWFASDSFILLPRRRDFAPIIDIASRIGVGILSYNDGEVVTVYPAKHYSIPSSYGSWLVNEWVLKDTRK